MKNKIKTTNNFFIIDNGTVQRKNVMQNYKKIKKYGMPECLTNI